MSKLPAFQFYPADWLKDPDLRRCSKAAKGVWIDMMCLMFECEDRGVFASGGKPWLVEEIAGAIGGDSAENLTCIDELLRKGVAALTRQGAISNRRMVRDDKNRADTKKRQNDFRKSNKLKENSNGNITHNVTALSHHSSSSTSSSTTKPKIPPPPLPPLPLDDDPEQNIPGDVEPLAGAMFVMAQAQIPSSGTLMRKLADVIPMLAKGENCTRGAATGLLLERVRKAQAEGAKLHLWLDDGRWKTGAPRVSAGNVASANAAFLAGEKTESEG